MKPLYQLLYKEYEGKPLDDYFIEQAFNRMMEEERELEPFISGLDIVHKKDKCFATYNERTGLITMNRKTIKKYTNDDKIKALAYLRHEMEHARNIKRYFEGREDLESTILEYALKPYAIKMGLIPRPKEYENDFDLNYFYSKVRENSSIAPDERIAEIRAWDYMVNLLKNQRTTKDLLTARVGLYKAYAAGYEDNKYYLESPTFQFFLNVGLLREHNWLKKRFRNHDYSFDTRILYGLPVTYKEYKEKILQKTRLKIVKRGEENEDRI